MSTNWWKKSEVLFKEKRNLLTIGEKTVKNNLKMIVNILSWKLGYFPNIVQIFDSSLKLIVVVFKH